jgi:hypothetical protein
LPDLWHTLVPGSIRKNVGALVEMAP